MDASLSVYLGYWMLLRLVNITKLQSDTSSYDVYCLNDVFIVVMMNQVKLHSRKSLGYLNVSCVL